MMLDNSKGQGRWLALLALCCGLLMTALDATIVTVALPSVAIDLHATGTSLTWLLNAYTLTYGGFLLLSGRLGDLYGARRLFLAGIVTFTLASAACGIADTEIALLIARAVQGLGGAAVTAVGLSLIANLFPDPTERARAMGIYGLVCATAGAVGQLLGGLLTGLLSWHAIFLVNLPIGAVVFLLCIALVPGDNRRLNSSGQLDIGGALTVTLASTLAIYALANGSKVGWLSAHTIGSLGLSGILLLLFVMIETRVSQPLVPLRLFRSSNFVTVNIVGVLWAGGGLGWSVIAALYLQRVLGYDPFHTGVAFAPATAITALLAGGLSAKTTTRFGIRGPLSVGLLLSAVGLALFARAPQDATFIVDILPAMLMLGLGSGIASTPFLCAAMDDVAPTDSGLVSGVLNTCLLIGGAVGLALLANLADMRTSSLQQAGTPAIAALNGGYHFAMLIGVLFNAMAAAGALLLRLRWRPTKVDQRTTSDLQQRDVGNALSRVSE